MKILYYLSANGGYITPCPNGMKLFRDTIMVGSVPCNRCKYFVKEVLKTVECRYRQHDFWRP
jgi:hypothetical protein